MLWNLLGSFTDPFECVVSRILISKLVCALQSKKYKLLCPRGTQTCALAVANIAHAVYLLDVAKRPIPQG